MSAEGETGRAGTEAENGLEILVAPYSGGASTRSDVIGTTFGLPRDSVFTNYLTRALRGRGGDQGHRHGGGETSSVEKALFRMPPRRY